MGNMVGNNILNILYTDIMRYRWGKTNHKPNNKVETSNNYHGSGDCLWHWFYHIRMDAK